MSGSFDNRGRGRGPHHPQPGDGQHQEPARQGITLKGPLTGPPASARAPQSFDPGVEHSSEREPAPELAPQSRQGQDNSVEFSSAPIVEAGSVTGRSLTLVISIMCFLACLTAGAVYMMNQSATAWLQNMSNEVTIQIEPRENFDIEQTILEVTSFLRLRPGISAVKPLDVRETAKLLEPWLGNNDGALQDLPIPRLIAIEIDSSAPPDLASIGASLKEQFPSVTLDDHRRWRQQITTVTRSFALGGLAILVLVGAATIAIIISATGSAMAANRDIVEVLNFVGATDRFIAHEFEKHFLTLGIKAGVVGAGCAMLVFWLMPMVMELLGGGAVTMNELNRLIGVGSLDLLGYLLLAAVVVVIAALCMLTSRFGVYRILNHQN